MEATTMSDDKAKAGADRKRIAVSEEYECRYGSEKFGGFTRGAKTRSAESRRDG
jgi:hypothetical protein